MHHEALALHHQCEADATDVFGFWLYIMTDCILFACLFATFLVLSMPGAPGPGLGNYVKLPDVLIETFLLLTSNFTFCLAVLSLYRERLSSLRAWLGATFVCGAGFIYMEITEFIHLAQEGFRWDVSGKASAFFALVGTHGLHVSFGLLWILVMMIQSFLMPRHIAIRRMTYLGLFWNFLDIVWIFVFTIVYLMGAV